MKILLSCGILVFGFACSAQAAETHGAHEHGAAKMNVLVDGSIVAIDLDSPLNTFLGFEHAPSTDAQRAAVRDMGQRLHKFDTLFVLTPAAQCVPQSVTLSSAHLDAALLEGSPATAAGSTAATAPDTIPDTAKNAPADKEDEHDHGDLDATFTFTCAAPQKLSSMDIRLFQEYNRLQKIEAQLVTPKGQKAAELTPQTTTLNW